MESQKNIGLVFFLYVILISHIVSAENGDKNDKALAATTASNDKAQAATTASFEERPSMRIEIYQYDKSITSSLDIDIILTNIHQKAFKIVKIKIFYPENLKALRISCPEQNSEQSKICLKETIDDGETLYSGSERTYRVNVPSAQLHFYKYLYESDALLFIPNQYLVRVEVEYTLTTEDKFLRFVSGKVDLSLETPLSSIIRGGILGALLLAIFIPIYRFIYDKINIKESLLQFLTLLISGSVISTIAILLLQRLANLALPITISVKDYLGGMVVGLFSYKIGYILYKQLIIGGNEGRAEHSETHPDVLP